MGKNTNSRPTSHRHCLPSCLQTEDASHVAIPLRKGDASATLLEAINTAIEELRADGTLKELSEKYFGQDISAEN